MKKYLLGKTGFEVSGVIYGAIISTNETQKDSDRYVSWSIERGVNYFDVAPSYGDAELRLGESLKPYRKDVYLVCKTTERKREGAWKEIQRSLELLKTDYFDNFQLHSVTTPEDVELAFGPGGTMELLLELREKGVIRKLGFSAHSEYAAIECLKRFDFDTVLFPTNYQLHMGQGFGGQLKALKQEKGFGLLGMKAFIERAWDNEAERHASPYPKSWCKPFGQEDARLRIAGMKYAVEMGADVLVPPGNFENFSFMVEHNEEVMEQPLTSEERGLLVQRFEAVKDRPFFLKNNGGWEASA